MSLKQGLILLGVQASKVQDDIGDFGNPKCYGMEAKTDASTDNENGNETGTKGHTG